jgi:electron transfer flavoprotein beta subunit
MLSVVKEINTPRLCTLGGKIRAKKTEIPVLGADDLPIPPEHLGLPGSPTKVVKVSYPQITRSGKKVAAADSLNGAVEEILSVLRGRGIV